MDLPTGTIKSHLHRGRAMMRKVMTAASETEENEQLK